MFLAPVSPGPYPVRHRTPPVNVQAREGVGERENRQALGTYGAAARAKGVKDRIQTRDAKFGDAAGG
jgi:hypothetical protein